MILLCFLDDPCRCGRCRCGSFWPGGMIGNGRGDSNGGGDHLFEFFKLHLFIFIAKTGEWGGLKWLRNPTKPLGNTWLYLSRAASLSVFWTLSVDPLWIKEGIRMQDLSAKSKCSKISLLFASSAFLNLHRFETPPLQTPLWFALRISRLFWTMW